MESPKVKEFLRGPLVSWFISCLEDPYSLATYDELVDGALLHRVCLLIDPELSTSEITASNGDSAVRIKNLEVILENVKQFYEQKLGHLLVKLPDVMKLGKEPESNVEEMKLLLLLILGWAIQCEKKEEYIMNITTFDETTQHAIVYYLKQITSDPEIVITQDSLQDVKPDDLFTLMKNIIEDRNSYFEKMKNLETKCQQLKNSSKIVSKKGFSDIEKYISRMELENEEDHFILELVELRSKERKLRLELKDKSKAFIESQAEVEHKTMLIAKLNEENENLMIEARNSKSYRDELDAAIERAEKAEQLELENSRYREKFNAIGFYKSRIEELLEDNSFLLDTKNALEYELNFQKKRADKIPELEAEVLSCKQNLEKIILKRLEEQSENSVETLLVNLQLENYGLSMMIDSMKRKFSSENSSHIQKLEKEKKEVKEIKENYEMLILKNSDLELDCKLAKQEIRILQASLRKQQLDIDGQLTLEPQYDQLSKNYVKLLQEQHSLRTNAYDANCKFKVLENSYIELEMKNESLQSEREKLIGMVKNSNNLREECTKLKEDFKRIYSQSKILDAERKSLFDQKNAEIIKLKLKLNEMAEELRVKEEICSDLESQVQDLNKRSQELLQTNSKLEDTKEKLMEDSRVLVLQCKEALDQAVEEKDNFCTERKTLSETISDMECQNEKLEETIFEFYRNAPGSNNNKGKSMTSNIVKKVKKVGSNFLSKNRQSSSLDRRQQTEDERSEFEVSNSTFESSKTMTLDRRLNGKRGPRDRFSLGTFRKEKVPNFSDDPTNHPLFSVYNRSLSEVLHRLEEESQDTNTRRDF